MTFVDADDRIEPDYIQTLYELCIRHQVPLAACNHHIIYPRLRRTRFPVDEKECTLEAPEALENVCYQQKPDVSSWGKLYAASLFDGLRFPEGQIYEDTAVFADIMLRAGRMAYTPRPLYHYILRSDSLSHGAYNQTRMDYIASVRRLCDTLKARYPELEQAALCRRVFAALSVRHYLVGCAKEHKPVRKELESYVKKNARPVLKAQKDVFPYFILNDGQPIGFIQYYIHNETTVGLDMWISEKAKRSRGFGSEALRQMVRLIHEKHPEKTTLFIDPEVENKRAVRCYEKAGFRHAGIFTDDEGNACCMMKFVFE